MAFHLQNQDQDFIASRPSAWPYEPTEAPAIRPGTGKWEIRMMPQGTVFLWASGEKRPTKLSPSTLVAASDDRGALERALGTFCQSLRGYFPNSDIDTIYGTVMGFNWTTGTAVQYGLASKVFGSFLIGTKDSYDAAWEMGKDFQRRAESDISEFWNTKHATA